MAKRTIVGWVNPDGSGEGNYAELVEYGPSDRLPRRYVDCPDCGRVHRIDENPDDRPAWMRRREHMIPKELT